MTAEERFVHFHHDVHGTMFCLLDSATRVYCLIGRFSVTHMEGRWSKREKSRITKRIQTLCKTGPLNALVNALEPLSVDEASTVLRSQANEHLSCLHIAAASNQPLIVDYLLTLYACLVPDARQDYARTPLHEAALHGHPEIVTVLLRHGALVSAHTTRGRTPLMYAARGGHTGVMTQLLTAGAGVDDQSETGITALYEAAKHGRLEALDLLIAHGAKLDLGSNTKHTPLHVSIGEGHLDVAERLIEAGASTSVQDAMGVSIWHEAAGVGTSALTLLRKHGVPLHDDHVDVVLARHPFHYAAVEGHAEFCAALLDAKMVDVNLQDIDGCTAVYYAAANGHVEVLRVLLEAGADPNIMSIRRSPLHCAVMWKREECVRMLIAHGALVDAKDKDGKTPQDIAHDNCAIAALLQDIKIRGE
ncbi:unnamed protein product [Aphanomyces euteiches]|uniref:Uncharacterized protein n=2 Tax=Aphanomyces euteiches TaxID=100861 RepID=A0A6G0XAN4_9STRA|nr:hypothetical protein Ae201684_006856 [Aphanomyces euteiches]KAH9086618.1 hypothetical protein Ae201684P_000040 [Aphanomyces euteiches]